MRILITALLLVPLLGGCAQVESKQKAMSLQSTIRAYESTIRWADFETARAFQRPGPDAPPGPDPASLRHIRVTSCESTIINISEDGTEAQVIADIRYYNDERMTVSEITDRQTWHYDGAEKRWILMSPLPAFR